MDMQPTTLIGLCILICAPLALYFYGLRIGRGERDVQHEIQQDLLNDKVSRHERLVSEQQHIADRQQQTIADLSARLREVKVLQVFDRSALLQAAATLDLAARTFDAFNAPQAKTARELRDECRSMAARLGWIEQAPPCPDSASPNDEAQVMQGGAA
ncbi:hypothetical protein ACFSB1_10840 [Halopseudomonas phragmitis]|uniref:Uncharacterized protein n=1 Tax=Halopseudomonas phragmitis TaxID=1931241 RepID=A0A1V0B9G7_9GAMM|nr:hypothetical protein [Halopseudomonas phragmitis]AQZ96579.1 hypothetical protein BVH74_18290 [Halopseudomonas phragmitis]